MYAHYEPQLYNVTLSGSYVSFSTNPLKVPYTKSSKITLNPASGYYFESISCSTGYTVSGFASGTSHYSAQTITVTNNTHVGGGSCTVKMHPRNYEATATYHPQTCTGQTNCREERYCPGEQEPCDPWECTCGSWPDGCCTQHFGSTCCSVPEQTHEVCDQYQYDCSYTTYSCPYGGTLSGTTCVF